MTAYDRFLSTYPRDSDYSPTVDSVYLERFLEEQVRVCVPVELREFWLNVGSGYFGTRRELYFFGDGREPEPRDSLVQWTNKDFWEVVCPAPHAGGPLFFAETCFGDQIGFRWNEGAPYAILLTVDTFEAFIIANEFGLLFSEILSQPDQLIDPELLKGVVERLGPLPSGKHYAPIVSPLLGASGRPSNFHIESANVHLRTAIAMHETIDKGSA